MWNLAPSSSAIVTQEGFSPVKTSLRQFNIATEDTNKTAIITEQQDALLGVVKLLWNKAVGINFHLPRSCSCRFLLVLTCLSKKTFPLHRIALRNLCIRMLLVWQAKYWQRAFYARNTALCFLMPLHPNSVPPSHTNTLVYTFLSRKHITMKHALKWNTKSVPWFHRTSHSNR